MEQATTANLGNQYKSIAFTNKVRDVFSQALSLDLLGDTGKNVAVPTNIHNNRILQKHYINISFRKAMNGLPMWHYVNSITYLLLSLAW